MIDNNGLKLTFWEEAIWHAADLHYRTMTVDQGYKTPTEALLGTNPHNSKLGVFGCSAFVHIHKEKRQTISKVGPTRELT